MNVFFCKCLLGKVFKKVQVAVSVAVSLGEKGADSHYGNQDAGNKEQNQTYTTVFWMLLLFLFLFQ